MQRRGGRERSRVSPAAPDWIPIRSRDSALQIVVFEPERRIEMHLGWGPYFSTVLSEEGARAWAQAFRVLLSERKETASEFCARMGARADSIPEPVKPVDPTQVLDLVGVPPLQALVKVQPVHPDVAREAGVDGTVLLHLLVGTDGLVHDVKVRKSIPMLDGAARESAWRWRFRPYVMDGVARSVWTQVPIKFSLH